MNWILVADTVPTDVDSLWNLAQDCGAGGLAIGLIGWWFWRKDKNESISELRAEIKENREYTRKIEKEQLTVLQELTNVIAESEAGGSDRHGELVRRIDEAVQTIVDRINARQTKA